MISFNFDANSRKINLLDSKDDKTRIKTIFSNGIKGSLSGVSAVMGNSIPNKDEFLEKMKDFIFELNNSEYVLGKYIFKITNISGYDFTVIEKNYNVTLNYKAQD